LIVLFYFLVGLMVSSGRIVSAVSDFESLLNKDWVLLCEALHERGFFVYKYLEVAEPGEDREDALFWIFCDILPVSVRKDFLEVENVDLLSEASIRELFSFGALREFSG